MKLIKWLYFPLTWRVSIYIAKADNVYAVNWNISKNASKKLKASKASQIIELIHFPGAAIKFIPSSNEKTTQSSESWKKLNGDCYTATGFFSISIEAIRRFNQSHLVQLNFFNEAKLAGRID